MLLIHTQLLALEEKATYNGLDEVLAPFQYIPAASGNDYHAGADWEETFERLGGEGAGKELDWPLCRVRGLKRGRDQADGP